MQRVIQPGSRQRGQVAARRRRPRYKRRLREQVLCNVTGTLTNCASALGGSHQADPPAGTGAAETAACGVQVGSRGFAEIFFRKLM